MHFEKSALKWWNSKYFPIWSDKNLTFVRYKVTNPKSFELQEAHDFFNIQCTFALHFDFMHLLFGKHHLSIHVHT